MYLAICMLIASYVPKAGTQRITPGLTGWAQVNGRDELPIVEKVKLDEAYMREQSF